jgi:hypothetical protein
LIVLRSEKDAVDTLIVAGETGAQKNLLAQLLLLFWVTVSLFAER